MASNFSIRHAAHIVKHGGVIAYPTDTIYGLGCDPFNPEAVEKINIIKQRPMNKRFILLGSNLDQFSQLVQLTPEQQTTIKNTAEPTSWVVTARPEAPDWLTAEDNTLTIRITQQQDVQRLCSALGHAIISTSANISGKSPARNSLELHRYFHDKVEKILVYNKLHTGKPSRIIRLSDKKIIRQ